MCRQSSGNLCVADQATLLLCIPKKDGTLHTALDAHKWNENTVKDVTPLPDQGVICKDIVQTKVRSKIDLTDTYGQVRICPLDVPQTMFMTTTGTYSSNKASFCIIQVACLTDNAHK